MHNLMRRTFVTKDTRGCEFQVTGYYERIEFTNVYNGVRFEAMGYVTDSLETMKELIGSL